MMLLGQKSVQEELKLTEEQITKVKDAQTKQRESFQGLQSLSAEERQLMDLRGQGRSWSEIAVQLGGTPEGRRKQLTRAADRVERQLRLDED